MAKRKQPEPSVGELHTEPTKDVQEPGSEAEAVTAQEGGTVLGEVIGEAVSELEAVTAEPVGVETPEVEEEDTIWSLMARAGYMVW